MKIVFFGTADFALPTLNALSLSRHKISAVVTAQDKRKGRGQKLSYSAVKLFAQKKKMLLFQPENLHTPQFTQVLKDKLPDLFVVCAYGRLLTKEILRIPKTYAINLHASLLPKYRGAAPINWAIIRGEKESGVTVFKMNEYMDRGELILQKRTTVLATDTAVSLTDKLSKLGAKALLEAIDLIEQGKASFTTQDETQATFAPKLKKEDGLINWKVPAVEIQNRIRGLQPWPGAFTYLDNKLLKIWESRIVESEQETAAGEIVGVDSKTGILVQTAKDRLLLTVLQLEGKRKMSAGEFIAGHNIKAGEMLGEVEKRRRNKWLK